jgi:hypothetical protein
VSIHAAVASTECHKTMRMEMAIFECRHRVFLSYQEDAMRM